MVQDIEIEALDHFGRGIAHLNSKVVFVLNALPGEIVDIEIISDKKTYSEAKVLKYKRKSPKRIESVCPYFDKCGGCNLLFYDYLDTIDFKLLKVKELIKKNKIDYTGDIEVIKNESPFYYRNKISLKIQNGKIGFYQDSTHKLVEIKGCVVANPLINKVIENFHLLNIKNGSLTVRCNSNDEILLVINSEEVNYDIKLGELKEIVKIVGIVYNDKLIYGDNFFYERIGGMLFKVSYNSFFQVNPFITKELFKLVSDNIDSSGVVFDLYSGVGTLSMVASKKAKEVIGIEIVPNAVVNATFNATINRIGNLKFILGDVSKQLSKLVIDFDTLIVDPPRKGLDKKTLEFIKSKHPQKVIYISCDVNTLMRDLKELENLYEIKIYKILDMFSYSYHLESFVVLESK